MKSYELHPTEGFASLTLVDRPSPPVGPTDIRVRIRAVSLNYRDLVIARGAMTRARPVIPASDGAGEVVEIGASVTRFKVGDRVAGGFFPTWLDGPLVEAYHGAARGGSIDGVLAEEVVGAADGWVAIPGHLSYEEAATLPCAGVTAWNALFEAAHVKPGDTVLVEGTGGVSLFALQLARAAGARVVVTSKSEAKRAKVIELGAAHTIDYVAVPAWGEAVRAWTGGRGVDVAVEVGGPGTFDQAVAALRFGGSLSLLGVLTGVRGEVNTHALFHKGARANGVYVGSVRMFEDLNRALEATQVRPIIDRSFDFNDARGAYEYLASAAHAGKVVIRGA